MEFTSIAEQYFVDSLYALRKAYTSATSAEVTAPELYDVLWVKSAVMNICQLWEHPKEPLKGDNFEHWFTVNVFSYVFDRCFMHPSSNLEIKR